MFKKDMVSLVLHIDLNDIEYKQMKYNFIFNDSINLIQCEGNLLIKEQYAILEDYFGHFYQNI